MQGLIERFEREREEASRESFPRKTSRVKREIKRSAAIQEEEFFLRYSTSNFFHLSEEDSLLCVDPERETPRENQS